MCGLVCGEQRLARLWVEVLQQLLKRWTLRRWAYGHPVTKPFDSLRQRLLIDLAESWLRGFTDALDFLHEHVPALGNRVQDAQSMFD